MDKLFNIINIDNLNITLSNFGKERTLKSE